MLSLPILEKTDSERAIKLAEHLILNNELSMMEPDHAKRRDNIAHPELIKTLYNHSDQKKELSDIIQKSFHKLESTYNMQRSID